MKQIKLIVGLGNPGDEYKNTRHNIGFEIIDWYASKKNISLSSKKFNGIFEKISFNDEEIIFAKPLTFMNLSGEFVKKIVDFYKIDIKNIFVVYDDMDLPISKIRLKDNGSSGGHNGIKNIINHLGTQEFKRLKFGIGKPNNNVIDFVIGKFSKEENQIIEKNKDKCIEIIDDFIKIDDFKKLMNKYN